MPDLYDVAAIGNAIVDVIAPCDDAFITDNGLEKGAMMLVDADQSAALYARMTAGIEASGGSAGNTIAGVASYGGRAAYMGKVSNDQLGEVFAHDMRAIGAHFDTAPLIGGPTTVTVALTDRAGAHPWRTTPVAGIPSGSTGVSRAGSESVSTGSVSSTSRYSASLSWPTDSASPKLTLGRGENPSVNASGSCSMRNARSNARATSRCEMKRTLPRLEKRMRTGKPESPLIG